MGARFTQRKVQIMLGQSVQGVLELEKLLGEPCSQRGGLVTVVGRCVEVAATLFFEEDYRGGQYLTTTRGDSGTGQSG